MSQSTLTLNSADPALGAAPTTEQIHYLPVPLVVPSRWQPRESFDSESLLELAKHIADNGLMYPIIVFKNEDDEFELVAGERRTRAVVALGLSRSDPWIAAYGRSLNGAIAHVAAHGWQGLPLDIKESLVTTTIAARIAPNDDHRRLHYLAIADNLQRQNLSALEEARALHDLMEEYSLSQGDVAKEIGWSQGKVSQRLSLLNLTAEARQAIITRVISPSHARHLATLPSSVQGAVTAHVTTLLDKEGSSEATVRKVAVLSQQLRAFLNPDHWIADEPVLPAVRNHCRLIRHLLQTEDLSTRGEDILRLREGDGRYSDHENLTGKKPDRLSWHQVEKIVQALTGDNHGLDQQWLAIAKAQRWTCEHCQLAALQPPVCRRAFDLPCWRWTAQRGDPDHIVTCRQFFTAEGEPLIIDVDSSLAGWANTLDAPGLLTGPFRHFQDYDAWRDLYQRAALAQAAQQEAAEMKRSNAYLVDLARYWAEQQDGLFANVDHFQAHRCEKCTHYRPSLLDRDLPPCQFALDPLSSRYNRSTSRAPEFAMLVQRSGLMVPRCEFYRVAITEIAPSPGFVLPDRDAVLDWLHRILVDQNRTTHSNTIVAPLAWLPYERTSLAEVHHLEKLLRYVKQAWDNLGDECVATLLITATSEVAAMARYRGTLDLLDPTTLQVDTWSDVGWNNVLSGSRPHGYPTDWPAPWMNRR